MKQLLDYFDTHDICKAAIVEYRDALKKKYQAKTVNVKLAAIHSFWNLLIRAEWKVKFLKVQRNAFAEESRELSEADYRELLQTAKSKKESALFAYAYVSGNGNKSKLSWNI